MVSGESIVGRDAEITLLRDRIEAAAQGARRIVLLTGPTGIGKSTLLAQVRSMVGDRFAAASVRVPAVGQPSGLFPIAEILSQLGPNTLERDQLASPLHLAARLGEIAGGSPAAIFVDDYQAVSRQTAEIIQAALRLTTGGVLLIATWRVDGAPTAASLPESSGDLLVDQITLRPLGPDDLARLAASVLAGPPLPSLLSALAGHSQGNPLFAVELLRFWAESGFLVRSGAYWSIGAGVAVTAPASLYSIVESRIRDLSPDAAEILGLLAAADRPVEHADLKSMSGGLPLAEGLRELAERGVVTTQQPGIHAITHPTFAEATLRRLDPARRAALHERHYEHLRSRSGAPPGRIAHHAWEAMVAPATLVPLLTASLDEALAVDDLRSAMRWYERLAQIAEPGDEAERLRLAREYGGVCLDVDAAKAALVFAQGVERFPDDVELWLGLARAERLLGRLDRAFDAAGRAAKLDPDDPDVQHLLGTLHGVSGDLTVAEEIFSRLAASSSPRIGHSRHCTRASILQNLATARYMRGDLAGATRYARDAMRVGGHNETVVTALNYAWCLVLEGTWDEAVRLVEPCLARAREHGDIATLCKLLGISAKLHAYRGATDFALDQALEAVALSAASGFAPIRVDALATLGAVHLEMGAAAEAFANLTHAAERARDLEELDEGALVYWLLAEAAALSGHADAGDEALRKASLRAGSPPTWESAIFRAGLLLDLARRDTEAAARRLAGGSPPDIPPYESAKTSLVSARVAAHLRLSGAEAHERHAGDLLRRLGRERPLPYLAAVDQILPPLRGRPPHRLPHDLTEREMEVGLLASSGLSNREIARRLVIAEKTASKHLERVFSKTGCSRRAQLSGLLHPIARETEIATD